MPDSDKNLDVRMSITEVKIQKIEEDLAENKIMLRDISVKVESVSNHFSKLNGTLPHIQETCNNIASHLEAVAEANHKQENKITKNSLSIKIILGILVPVVIGISGALIKIFLT